MATYSTTPNKFIFIFSGLMILAVLVYYAFMMADRYFLTEVPATATVVGKEYHPISEQYRQQNIGGRKQTVKIMVPEAWLLSLDVDGKRSQAQVPREVYEATPEGAKMDIRYKKFRITGTWQVTQVLGKTKG